jgi:hypothetical protein
MTVRQVFYRMVVAELIGKTEKEYHNTVSRLLVKMRRAGELPFNWISDNTRWMRKPRTWSSMQEALAYTAQTYRRALWDEQNDYVEIWTEKDALAGVLLEETRVWDVPLMVSRGFSSVTYLYEAAQAIQQTGKPTYVYYFGDHDPSGLHIDRSIERRLREFASDAEIYFERVAVKPEQIEAWSLPTRPTKTERNAHAKNFRGDSVEVDAIDPTQLRGLVSDCITRHVNQVKLEATRLVEEAERKTVEAISANSGNLASNVNSQLQAIVTAARPHERKEEFLARLTALHKSFARTLSPEEMQEALASLRRMVSDWDVKAIVEERLKARGPKK